MIFSKNIQELKKTQAWMYWGPFDETKIPSILAYLFLLIMNEVVHKKGRYFCNIS